MRYAGLQARFLRGLCLPALIIATMPQTDRQTENEIAAFVSRDAALAMVRELAALGPRTGGTPKGDRAATLIATGMRDLGLSVEVLDDPPAHFHEALAWTATVDGQPLASAHPWINAPSMKATTLKLVDGDAKPAENDALKGAAVLASRGGRGLAAFREAGAAAILTDYPSTQDRYVDWAFIGEQAEDSTVPVFGLSFHDGAKLRNALKTGKEVRVTLSLESRSGEGRPRTVVGTLAGAGASAHRTIVVCAHGDSDGGGPGADDNASGVAAVMEVARALAQAARLEMLPQDRPRILFIVWGKEYHSSEAWVRANDQTMADLVAVINYDQVGTGARRSALYYEGNDLPGNAPLLRIVESVAVDHAGEEGFWTEHTSCPLMGGTDAFAFVSRKHGGTADHEREIAATTVFTAAWDRPKVMKQTEGWASPGWPPGEDVVIDYSRFYHSAADTPANTTEAEPRNMEAAARLVALTIRRLMRDAATP